MYERTLDKPLEVPGVPGSSCRRILHCAERVGTDDHPWEGRIYFVDDTETRATEARETALAYGLFRHNTAYKDEAVQSASSTAARYLQSTGYVLTTPD